MRPRLTLLSNKRYVFSLSCFLPNAAVRADVCQALADRHSTVEEAIAVGKWMEAEFVVLTHFSNRFESGKFPNIWSPAFLDLAGMQGRLLVAADLLRLPVDSAQLQLIATQVLPRLQALASE